jgi:hypothetical protein
MHVCHISGSRHAVATNPIDLILGLLLPLWVQHHGHQEELKWTTNRDNTNQILGENISNSRQVLVYG